MFSVWRFTVKSIYFHLSVVWVCNYLTLEWFWIPTPQYNENQVIRFKMSSICLDNRPSNVRHWTLNIEHWICTLHISRILLICTSWKCVFTFYHIFFFCYCLFRWCHRLEFPEWPFIMYSKLHPKTILQCLSDSTHSECVVIISLLHLLWFRSV